MIASVVSGVSVRRNARWAKSSWCIHDTTQLAPSSITPPRRFGEPVEQPVEDEHAEEERRRVADGEEVLRADVLAAAEMIGDRAAVVVERPVEQAATATDVQDERYAAVVQRRPERIEVGVRGRPVAGGGGGDVDRRAAGIDGLGQQGQGPIGIVERDESHREQAGVVLAEVGDREVVGRAARVQQVEVLAHEHRRGERREHELSVEAEHVDDVAAFRRVERAHRVPALVDQQPLLGRRPGCLVVLALGGVGGRLVEHRRKTRHLAAPQPFDHVGRHERIEEAGQLHQMAVGVEHSTAPRVGHDGLRSVTTAR